MCFSIPHSTCPTFCKAFMSDPRAAKAYGYEDARAVARGFGFARTTDTAIYKK